MRGRIALEILRNEMPAQFGISLVDLHDGIGQQQRIGLVEHLGRTVDMRFDDASPRGFAPRTIRSIDPLEPKEIMENEFPGENSRFRSGLGQAVEPDSG